MFFTIAESIPKSEFISIYKESLSLLNLAFLPFGGSSIFENLDEVHPQLIEEYTSVFQKLEEVLSRKTFTSKNYDDDRIIFSMNEYAGESKEEEIMTAVQNAMNILRDGLKGPIVVEFKSFLITYHETTTDVVTAKVTALILHKVVTALKLALTDNESSCSATLIEEDQILRNRYNIKVPIRIFSPIKLQTKPFYVTKFTKLSLDALSRCLSITEKDLLNEFAIDNFGNTSGSDDTILHTFSIQEYYALIDTFGRSEEVSEMMRKYHDMKPKSIKINNDVEDPSACIEIQPNILPIDQLRHCCEYDLQMTTHPMVAYYFQMDAYLECLSQTIQERSKSNQSTHLYELVYEDLQGSYTVTNEALRLWSKAHQAISSMNDTKTALKLLNKALKIVNAIIEPKKLISSEKKETERDNNQDELDREEKDDDEEYEDLDASIVSNVAIPVYVKHMLFMERAAVLQQDGKIDAALNDCNAAMQLDPHSMAAYSLRSQLYRSLESLQTLDNTKSNKVIKQQDKECIDFGEAAAKDALAAFLLGGSSDISLAAAVEETARENCRKIAKSIFFEKNTEKVLRNDSHDSEDCQPRSWWIAMYFSGYCLLSEALDLFSNPYEDNGPVSKAVVGSKAGNAMHEIDETDTASAVDTNIPLHLIPDVQKIDGLHLDEYLSINRTAFELLVCLVDLLDYVSYQSVSNPPTQEAMVNPKNTTQNGSSSSQATDLSKTKPTHEVSSKYFEILPNEVGFDDDFDTLVLLDEGDVEIDGDNEILTSQPHITTSSSDPPSDQLEVFPHPMETETVPPCPYFKTVLQLLRSDSAKEITGIQFCSMNGRIQSMDWSESKGKVQLLSALNKSKKDSIDHFQADREDEEEEEGEEEQWEDIDEEDDDGDEEEDDPDVIEKMESNEDDLQNAKQTIQSVEEASSRQCSWKIKARLLNICGSCSYLAGDAINAVKCFRESIRLDPWLIDSRIKLGALLVDMDDLVEAKEILSDVVKYANQLHSSSYQYAYLLTAICTLHLAEYYVHSNDFKTAVSELQQVQRSVKVQEKKISSPISKNSAMEQSFRKFLREKWIQSTGSNEQFPNKLPPSYLESLICKDDRFEKRFQLSIQNIHANVHALYAVGLFRLDPSYPERTITILEASLLKYPNSNAILLCLGEISGHIGDIVRSINCCQQGHRLQPYDPMPFMNASRIYQQLGQLTTARMHISMALKLDPAFAMTLVDLSQSYLHAGDSGYALSMLDKALDVAKHVSEIKDVLSARSVALMQNEFENKGLCPPIVLKFT